MKRETEYQCQNCGRVVKGMLTSDTGYVCKCGTAILSSHVRPPQRHIRLIAFCGPQRHGKSTAVEYLKNRYSAKPLTFAGPVKEIADKLFGPVSRQDRSKPVPFYPWETPVEIWQKLGTEAVRSQWPNAWVEYADRTVEQAPDDLWANDDLRFPNEHGWARKRGGLIVRVTDPRKPVSVLGIAGHASESFRDIMEVDVELVNDGTLEDYYQKIDQLVQKLG